MPIVKMRPTRFASGCTLFAVVALTWMHARGQMAETSTGQEKTHPLLLQPASMLTPDSGRGITPTARGGKTVAVVSTAKADARIARTAGPEAEGEAVPRALAIPSLAPTKAVARFEGTAAPGLSVVLSAEGSTGEDLRFLWVQTRGPEVHLDRPDAARATFLVPSGATDMAFHLVVAGRSGVDRKVLDIPIELHARPTLPPIVVADAGDDQVAVVGHRVTLNGIRSTPRERAAFRWIQVAGPEAIERNDEAWICSFVPVEPGIYRFLLVVAADGIISPPDEVRVAVQSEAPAEIRPSARIDLIDRFARGRIREVEGGRAAASRLADAFDGVAERMSLYRTYEDVFSEASRRIEAAVQAGTAPRDAWDRLVFEPLSGQIVEGMLGAGLDLDRDEARTQPLSGDQKARLAALFRGIGRGLRAGASDAEESAVSSNGKPSENGSD